MVRFGFGGLRGCFLGCVGFYSCRGHRWGFLPYGVSVGWWWVGSYCCAHGSCPGMLRGELGSHSPHGLPIHPTASPHTPLPLHTPHYLPVHPGDAPAKSPRAYPNQGTAAQPQSTPYRQPGLRTSRPNPARCSMRAAWAAPGTSWRGNTQVSTLFSQASGLFCVFSGHVVKTDGFGACTT